MNSLRTRLGTALLAIVSTLLALAGAEWALRAQRAHIEASNVTEPGLLRYDARLGWTLNPLWQGRHRHHDFAVEYHTDLDARRKTPAAETRLPGNDWYWVGDSYTFGFGVADTETFVNRLDAPAGAASPGTAQPHPTPPRATPAPRHLNAGIPGFSTDQELLLIETRILPRHPAAVGLVVYLGNDLFDNTLPFPVQAENAKPYFSLDEAGRLRLHNTPVPRQRRPTDTAQRDLSRFVLGDAPPSELAPLTRIELLRRLGWRPAPPSGWEAGLGERHAAQLALFTALLTRMDAAVRDAGAALHVFLLPSPDAVRDPDGIMGRMQRHLATEIARRLAPLAIAPVDLTPALRAAAGDGAALFFPNEGHLTPRGHQVVADAIRRTLPTTSPEPAAPDR